MRFRFALVVVLFLTLLFGRADARSFSRSTPRPGIIVTGIQWVGDHLLVRSTAPLTPRMMTLSQPDRVVIDLMEAELGDAALAQTIRVGRGGLAQIRIAQHPAGYLRLVFDCTQPTVLLLHQPKGENLLLVQSGDPGSIADLPKPSPTPFSFLEKVRPGVRPVQALRPSLLSLVKPSPTPPVAWHTAQPLVTPSPCPTPASVRSIRGIRLEQRGGQTLLTVRGEKSFPYQVSQLFSPPRILVRVPRATFEGRLPEVRGGATHLAWRREGGDLLIEVGMPDPFFRMEEEGKGDHLLVSWKAQKSRLAGLVVIDPGHGGVDPGAIGAKGLRESHVNLEMGLKLQEEMKKYGVQTLLTRDTDTFVDLPSRPNFAEQKGARLFVSLHCNACPNPDVAGVETYYRQNDGVPLAKEIHRLLVEDLGRPDRGVKQARLFVLRSTAFPSVLVETAFISNGAEEALLEDGDFQHRAVQAIAGGIYRYLTAPGPELLTNRDSSKSVEP